MRILIVACLVLFSSCGVMKDLFNPFDDEEAGTPVRSLEEHAPDGEDLPTPAQAVGMRIPMNAAIYSSVGFYSRGKLWSHWPVLDNEYWTVRKSTVENSMNYANIFLWAPVHDAAKSYFAREPRARKIVVWDITHMFGGFKSGHVSHQNGNDFDFRYPLIEENKPISMANIDMQKAWSLAASFVEAGHVSRIFTDAKYKKYFCDMKNKINTPEPLKTETLRALRPWRNHSNHYHVRFKCPVEDKLCVNQTEPPIGDGCGGL